MKIDYNIIKNFMEEEKYIANDSVIWQMAKDIGKMEKDEQKGQDIYAICLEGPPGAGKSFYAETYKKVLEKVYNEKVEMIEYQCDGTTGKAELYEEIRVASAIAGNPDEVIIAGKLVEAIEKVNTGKKVILFLDEFEKSRRETDSFMYGFLQKGIVITTQKGKLKVKPEYTKNLQVILCKNDERELSDPLLRRCYIMRLEEMTPENFYKTINMNLPEYDQDVKDVVALIYEKMYANIDEFEKFPSCSEGMKAIQDACDYIQLNAPEEVIYCDILSNLLKHPDDIQTFKFMFEKDTEIGQFVKKMIKSKTKVENNAIRDEIYREFYSKELQKIATMKQEIDTMEETHKQEINTIEEKYKQEINIIGKKHKIQEEWYEKIIKDKDNTIKNLKAKKTNENETNSNIEENKEKKEIIEFEEINPNEKVIYYEPDVIGNNGSVFDDNKTNKWYEIMKIKVNEEGIRVIEKILKEKIDDENENIKNLYEARYGLGCDYLRWRMKERAKLINKKSICIDGIILAIDNDKYVKDDYKIIARRIEENNEYFYKIYSNKKIQVLRYFKPSYEEENHMGVESFINFLDEYNMILDFEENFLLVTQSPIYERRNGINHAKRDMELLEKYGIIKYIGHKKCAKIVAPYMYKIFSINQIQDGTTNNDMRDSKYTKNTFDTYLQFEYANQYEDYCLQMKKLQDMYSKMLEYPGDIVVQECLEGINSKPYLEDEER